MNLRASRLPLTMACAASIVPPAVRIERGDNQAALNGTAAHHVLLDRIIGRCQDAYGLDTLTTDCCKPADACDRTECYGADLDEVEMLVGMGWRAWQQLARYYPTPSVETHLIHDDSYIGTSRIELSGHIDVLQSCDDHGLIADYKTGFLDSDYWPQMMGYAWLCFQEHPEWNTVTCSIVWVRDGSIETRTITRLQSLEWFETLREQLADTETYTPGRHCGYCPRAWECPARRQMIAAYAVCLIELADDNASGRATEIGMAMGAVYDRAKLIQKAAESVIDDLIRPAVELAGGTIDLGDGRELVLRPTQKDVIDPVDAWPTLVEAFNEHNTIAMMTVSKTRVSKEIGDLAKPRQKGKTIEAFLQRLRDAGAMTKVDQSPRLECRRKVEQIEKQ